MALTAEPKIVQNNATIILSGTWSTRQIDVLPQKLSLSDKEPIEIEAQGIIELDTAGALLLNQYLHQLDTHKVSYQLKGLKPEWQQLISLVAKAPSHHREPKPIKFFLFELIGEETAQKISQFFHFFDFIGRIVSIFGRALYQPRRFHPKSIINTMDQNGARALPIVGLLCFLIGVVLAYQLGNQLRTYGANIFIVYLTGVAILREFGPLITAIILAGRTSSSFTAEIGTMKVNQEIDALQTMGLYPSEFLVIPKILGLLIVFPLLIFWADVFGVLGSMFMAKISLGIGYKSFLNQFAHSVEIKQLFIGLSKAPVFALIIGLVGCYQGFQVEYNADSVGKQTTKSVVQAIFLIIIADAAFSVFYSLLGL